jgi:hypothetical protein
VIVLVALAMAADWIVANRFYAPREGVDAERAVAAEFAADEARAVAPPPVPPAPSTVPPPLPPSEVPA